MVDPPLALFITWSVYGTHLQGDEKGWWRPEEGHQPSQPPLANWHRDRLTHPVLLLDASAHLCVERAIEEHCSHREWKLWAQSVRSNHAHVVVSANELDAKKVRDQLKANATGKLRRHQSQWIDRPVWTAKGWIEFIDTDNDLETVMVYTTEAQDRKSRDEIQPDVSRWR